MTASSRWWSASRGSRPARKRRPSSHWKLSNAISWPRRRRASCACPRQSSGKLRTFLGPSPYIESDDPRIREAARQVVAEKPLAWEQAEAIFDWVRGKVEYRFDRNIKGARQALDDGFGDCEELTSLFVAMCRAVGIPARAVWVPGHCYPEFYLEDEQGQGHWYPCQAAGTRIFGAMPEARPILQKGDNFRAPGSRQALRYVQETLTAKNATADPEVQFVQKSLDAPDNVLEMTCTTGRGAG